MDRVAPRARASSTVLAVLYFSYLAWTAVSGLLGLTCSNSIIMASRIGPTASFIFFGGAEEPLGAEGRSGGGGAPTLGMKRRFARGMRTCVPSPTGCSSSSTASGCSSPVGVTLPSGNSSSTASIGSSSSPSMTGSVSSSPSDALSRSLSTWTSLTCLSG